MLSVLVNVVTDSLKVHLQFSGKSADLDLNEIQIFR